MTEPASPKPAEQSDEVGPDGPWTPAAERIVSDVETLKAISDPLRLRILETMVGRDTGTWSVKELAAELDVPQTRLYHHVELLLERDLIRVAEQRVVSGIIESRYRVAALSLRLDHRLLSGDAGVHAAGRELLHTVFDDARDEVAKALHAFLQATGSGASGDVASNDVASSDGAMSHPDRPVVSRGLARLTPEHAAELRTRLAELMTEYESDATSPEAEPWGFLVAFYRVPTRQGR